MALLSDDFTNWITAGNTLVIKNFAIMMLIIQRLGTSHQWIREKEIEVEMEREKHASDPTRFDAVKAYELQYWRHAARYCVKELFDIVGVIEKGKLVNEVNSYRGSRDFKKKLNLIRQPLAKIQVAGTGRYYHWPQAVFFPDERSFGWSVYDEKGITHHFSRLWMAEHFLQIILEETDAGTKA
jgi:hypothetical protein